MKALVGTVTVIGAGVIGGAIVKCLVKSRIADNVIATRRDINALIPLADLGANISDNNIVAANQAEIVFLCVKPNDLERVLLEIKDELKGKLVISTAAVIPIASLEKTVPEARFVRTMPNIAAMVSESFTAYSMGTTTVL